MLLTIHNLPSATRYADIKTLLQSKCGIQQVILDNLVSEGNSKKVTVGVAEDADAAILTRKINGLFWNGQQLYVEDVRQQKAASDQPYRSLNPQPQRQEELPYNSMNLAQNSSFDMIAAQQMMTPMYYMPIPAYPSAEAYGANIMNKAQGYGQEKVQSAYPGISGFAQNASAAPGASQFDNRQDMAQPAKRSRWEDDQDAEKSLYGRRYDQNRDWQNNRRASPPRDQSHDRRNSVWQAANDGPMQLDFRANVRPTQPDYRSNAGPTQPDFRPNVRPTEPEFRSTIRPDDRSDFVRPGLLDKPRREFGSNVQRRENDRQGRSDEREIFSRRSNDDTFSRRPTDEFSRRPNEHAEFSRRSNEHAEFSRRPNEHAEFSRRLNQRAEFSRRPNVPDRSNERQGTNQFSGRPSGREELSRRPNEEFSRRSNDREERPRRPNERAEFSKRSIVPNRSNERQGTNQFSERQVKPSRFNQPGYARNSGFDRNDLPDESRHGPGSDYRSIPDLRKRKFEETKPKSWGQQASAPPKTFKEQFASQHISAPPLTEQAKEKLNKRMRMSGTNKILHDIYTSLNFANPDIITRKIFRQFVRERLDDLLGDRKMVTTLEILELYRAKYPKSGDRAAHEVVVERIAQEVANQESGGNQEVNIVKPAVQTPTPAGRPPPPKPLTKGERRAKKNLKEAKQLLSQGKVPTFPLGDKSKVAQQRKEEKQGIIPETEPITKAALTDEVDSLIKICTDELVNPPDETTRQIYKSVCPEEFIVDIKTIITQTLARRVTDSGLKVVRIYGGPNLPKREVLEKFLLKFGVQSLRKSEKSKMYTAAVDTYKNFDRLCNSTCKGPDGSTVHFKPFHVTPKQRADQAALRKQRKLNLSQMIDRSELNLLDKDWPAKEEQIKAREAEKQAVVQTKLAAEKAAFENQKALEDSQAVKTENVTEEPNGNGNTENVETDITNTTTNEENLEVDQTTTVNESNEYLNDDFHVIDEVNETDSDLECLGENNQVFYIDEDVENVVANDESVNNDNDVDNNDDETAVGESTNDSNDNENVQIIKENENIGEDKIVEDKLNKDGENVTDSAGPLMIDDEDKDNLLCDDSDFEMCNTDIDSVPLDLDELEDY